MFRLLLLSDWRINLPSGVSCKTASFGTAGLFEFAVQTTVLSFVVGCCSPSYGDYGFDLYNERKWGGPPLVIVTVLIYNEIKRYYYMSTIKKKLLYLIILESIVIDCLKKN